MNGPTSGTVGHLQVCRLQREEESFWDDFVWRTPSATFFHLMGWRRAIERTFGYEPHYYYAMHNGRISGVLPLFEASSWLQGKCLISTPMAVNGGISAMDEDSRKKLLEFACGFAQDKGVQHLELRQRDGEIEPGFYPNQLYSTFFCELNADPETMFRRLPRDTRYMIRKAQKNDLSVQSGLDNLPEFYNLFGQSMQRLGTPVLPRALFTNLVKEFGGLCDILVVRKGKKAVAAVFSFRFRDTILPYYAGASAEAPRLAANNLLYWELMIRSAREGLRWFDFGRSKKGTGAFAFKTQWQMTEQTLSYQIRLVKRKHVPNFTPLNPKFERAVRIWRKLPLDLANFLGPRVVRWFP